MLVRVGEQLVVVDLNEKRNLVRILARHGAKDTKCGCHGIATSFDGELDDILRIKIGRILGEARSRGMLDALIHRKNGEIASACQAAGVIHPIQVVQDALVAVGRSKDPVHPVRTGQVQQTR